MFGKFPRKRFSPVPKFTQTIEAWHWNPKTFEEARKIQAELGFIYATILHHPLNTEGPDGGPTQSRFELRVFHKGKHIMLCQGEWYVVVPGVLSGELVAGLDDFDVMEDEKFKALYKPIIDE